MDDGHARPAVLRSSWWKGLLGGLAALLVFVLVPGFGGVAIVAGGFAAAGSAFQLQHDDELRAVASRTVVTVIDVDVRRGSGPHGTGSPRCVPVVSGVADGRPHTWELGDFPRCGIFRTGQHLEVLYDPGHLDRAAIADGRARDSFRNNRDVGLQVLTAGTALAAIGTGCWIWLVRHIRRASPRGDRTGAVPTQD